MIKPVVVLCLMVLPWGSTIAAAVQEWQVAARGPRFFAADADRKAPIDVSELSVLRRRVTLALERVSIDEALKAVTRQARLQVTYSGAIVPLERRVSIRAQDITVAAALTELLFGLKVDVEVARNGHIALVRRGAAEAGATQGGVITGRVSDAKTQRGVPNADVFLEGTSRRASTDTAGRYRLSDVEVGSYTLAVRRLGYAKESRAVTVVAEREDTVDVVLQPLATKLQELVTTASGQQRRMELGNDITTIRADSVLRAAPIKSLTDLLENRVPGLTVQRTSGAPGDPSRLRLGGIGSMLRNNDPIVFVDGVRVYAVHSDARSGNLSGRNFEGDRSHPPAPSPLDQIDPNNIEKIEVLKGPAAATQYGADAANGVIVVTTKKGRPGPPSWNASVTHGRSTLPGEWPVAYFRWGHSIYDNTPILCPTSDPECQQDSLVRYQALNDPDATILGTGRSTGLSLGVSGGTQTLTYSVTGSFSEETGIVQLPAFEIERFRARFSREPEDWMRRPQRYTTWGLSSGLVARLGSADVSVQTSLYRSTQQRSSLEGQVQPLSVTYLDKVNGTYYRPSTSAAYNGSGVGAGITVGDYLEEFYRLTTASSIRSMTGINMQWRPRDWMIVNATGGLDVQARDDQTLIPRGLPHLQNISLSDPSESDSNGVFNRGTGTAMIGSLNMYTTMRASLPWKIMLETTVGGDISRTTTGDLVVESRGLAAGTSTSAGAASITGRDTRTGISSFGWYIQPQLRRGNFYLPLAIRFDGGSAFGEDLDFVRFPKLATSWVVSEEPFFSPLRTIISSFRLRAAYGQAGRQPGTGDRLRLYSVAPRWLDGQTVDQLGLSTLGNTGLRPERTVEIEGGVDADLFDGRLSLVLTGSRKTTDDALMFVPLPLSLSGLTGLQFRANIGVIRNTRFDATIAMTPIRSPALTWQMQLAVIQSRNTLVEFGPGAAPFFTAEGGAAKGVETGAGTRMVPGYPVAGRWDRPIVAFADENGDGVLQEPEIKLGDTLVYLGQPYPDYQTTLSSNIGLFGGAVSIATDISYESGASQMQLNNQRYAGWVLSRGLADPSAPMSAQAAAIAEYPSGNNNTGFHGTSWGTIQAVSMLRFNSLSVGYQAPPRVAKLFGAQRAAIAIQGRNLGLHSDYRGMDPNVSAWAPGEQTFDTGQLPQSRLWQFRVDLMY